MRPEALRVVDESVRDHSSLRQGERAYLSFILAFLRNAIDAGSDYEVIEGRVGFSEPIREVTSTQFRHPA
jgi:hypothetical protein